MNNYTTLNWENLEEKGEITNDTAEIQRIIRDYMPIKWTTMKKWTNSWKGTLFQA